MKRLILAVCLFGASQAWASAYFIAPAAGGGSDSNPGTSGSPWLTLNHTITSADTVTAKAGAYSAQQLSVGSWGTVTGSGHYTVMVNCASFLGCTITPASGLGGIWIDASHWGISGFIVDNVNTSGGGCITASPYTNSVTIYDIVIANNVAERCKSNGVGVYPKSSTASVDYVAVIGNIIWSAAHNTNECDSGISIYEPLKQDSLPGTHIYVAGNFSFDNVTPNNCNNGSSTYDGEGVAFDDFGMSQQGGATYTQQAVAENNILVHNGGYGFGVTGSGTQTSQIYFVHNTSADNMTASPTSTTTCGNDALIGPVSLVESFKNLEKTDAATGCSGPTTKYVFNVNGADATDQIYTNFWYSAAGHNGGIVSSPGFAYGSNTTGTDPQFTSEADPGAPSCSGKASTVDCMSTVIANYTPATTAAKAYGYQKPSSTSVYNPLYPQWLCSVTNLPTGLVTPGCVTAGTLSSIK